MLNTKYQFLTLSPKDAIEKQLFWEFRVKELWNSFLLLIVLTAIGAICNGILTLIESNAKNIKSFLCFTVNIFILVLIFLINKRFKGFFVYLMPAMKLISFIQIIFMLEDSS